MRLLIGKWEIIITIRFYKDKKGGYFRMAAHKLDENVDGISSNCGDGYHVGFFDMDNWILDYDRVKELQVVFDLGNIYILETARNNYHLICLDKHSLGFWYDVLMYMDADRLRNYANISLKRQKFILRISPKKGRDKPRYVDCLKRANMREKSNMHYRYLKIMYDPIPVPKWLDNSSLMEIERYTTYEAR